MTAVMCSVWLELAERVCGSGANGEESGREDDERRSSFWGVRSRVMSEERVDASAARMNEWKRICDKNIMFRWIKQAVGKDQVTRLRESQEL